ncbi:hypothetical protein [Rosistilla oblonga]|uniref:hypothetical protein n=1 Tax=Rosistilla oblonga TaxID=2527990 RepID=UPI003A96A853
MIMHKILLAASVAAVSIPVIGRSINAQDAVLPDPVPVAAEAYAEGSVPYDFFAFADAGVLRLQIVDLQSSSRVSVSGLNAKLIAFDGKSMTAPVTPDGAVEFRGVRPGTHSVLFAGPGKFAAIAIYVRNRDQQTGLIEPLYIPTIAVSSDLEIRNFTNYLAYAKQQFKYDDRSQFAHTPMRAKSFYMAQLQADGLLMGRVYAVSDQTRELNLTTQINIYQRGRKLQTVVSDASGGFTVAGLEPGVYDVVSNGWLGYSAFSFQLLPAQSAASAVKFRKTAFRAANNSAQAAGPTLEILLIPGPMRQFLRQSVDSNDNQNGEAGNTAAAPGAAGGSSAGSGGGGSGGGGSGGGGAAAGLAALGAAAAAAASGGDGGASMSDTTASSTDQ